MADLKLLNLSVSEILNIFKTAYYDTYGETMKIGSDEFAASSVFSYCISVLFNASNDLFKQRFLATATGEFLDAIAETYGIIGRPQGYPASCSVRVTAPAAYRDTRYTIPAGALKISDSSRQYVFVNKLDTVVRNSKDVLFVADRVGTELNGIPAGTLSEIVSGSQYAATAVSISITEGGSNSMENDDEAFRVWLKTEIQSFSGAGTYLAYEARAKNSDPHIIDAYCVRQGEEGYEKGKVKIYILTDENTSDPDSIVKIAYNACNDGAFRPVGDFIEMNHVTDQVLVLDSLVWRCTYPRRFASLANERNTRILSEYQSYLRQKLNRPFIYAEFVERLKAVDGDGVYCTDVVVSGFSSQGDTAPIYPAMGSVLKLESFVFENVIDELDA